MPKKPPPKTIDAAKIICFTFIDERHRPTGRTRHTVAGELLKPVFGLAVARYEGDQGYYLFYCDENWKTLTDTWHETLEEAQEQAVFEYEGIEGTWVTLIDSGFRLYSETLKDLQKNECWGTGCDCLPSSTGHLEFDLSAPGPSWYLEFSCPIHGIQLAHLPAMSPNINRVLREYGFE